MARKKITTKVCDRCAIGKEKVAEQTIRFGISESWYEIDLCDVHARMIEREIDLWARLARPSEAPTAAAEPPRLFTPEKVASLARAAELRTAEQSRTTAAEAVAEAELAVVGGSASRRIEPLPPSADDWGLSDHARERAELRGFDLREVLRAAVDPEQSYRQPRYGPNAALHQRGEIAVAVDTETKTVISVLHRTTEQYDPNAHRSEIRSAR